MILSVKTYMFEQLKAFYYLQLLSKLKIATASLTPALPIFQTQCSWASSPPLALYNTPDVLFKAPPQPKEHRMLYSQISLVRTPKQQSEVSVLERCQYKRGQIWLLHLQFYVFIS